MALEGGEGEEFDPGVGGGGGGGQWSKMSQGCGVCLKAVSTGKRGWLCGFIKKLLVFFFS